MDPNSVLRQIAYWLDRNRHDPRRVMAYRNVHYRRAHDARKRGAARPGQEAGSRCGSTQNAKVIAQAWPGCEPDLLAEYALMLRISSGGAIRAALRGGSICIRTGRTGPRRSRMMRHRGASHQYCALTDHSPRLTIANGPFRTGCS